MQTHQEEFPAGTRVKVHAALRREGSDHDWHGHTGTVVGWRGWCEIKMDKEKRGWPKGTVLICGHNIRILGQ